MKNIGNDPRSLFNGNHFSSIGGVRTFVQNASCYFSKLKLCSPIIGRAKPPTLERSIEISRQYRSLNEETKTANPLRFLSCRSMTF